MTKAYLFAQAPCPECNVLMRVSEKDRDYLECGNHMCTHDFQYPRPMVELKAEKHAKDKRD